jgi:glycosyltransferase involved in cell wall biosynthesis
LREKGVDVLICGVLERWTTLPTLALVPDFQHVHLPELFEPQDIAWRNAEYRKTAERATRVLVFSESVRADLEQFAPPYAGKARVLPPVSAIPDSVYEQDPGAMLSFYSLPEKFVYMPNQFWQHKNHLRAFDAVRQLRARGEKVFLVCTGNPGDTRNAAFFSEVLQTISRYGLRDQLALLGSVPRADVFSLMRQAAFVLNPSRFEGYGLSLAEARAVGKRVLASDLPAHREQNVPCVQYVNPDDVSDLAEKIGELWASTQPGPDLALEARARQEQPGRIRAYAGQLMQIIREVMV